MKYYQRIYMHYPNNYYEVTGEIQTILHLLPRAVRKDPRKLFGRHERTLLLIWEACIQGRIFFNGGFNDFRKAVSQGEWYMAYNQG